MAKFNPVPTGVLEEPATSRLPTQAREPPSEAPETADGSVFAKSVRTGILQLASAERGLRGAVAGVLGADEYAKEQLRKQKRIEAEMEYQAPPILDIRDVKDIGSLADYLQGVVGTQLPVMVALAAGGPTALGARAIARTLGAKALGRLTATQTIGAGIAGSGSALETGVIFPEVAEQAKLTPENESLREQGAIAIGGGLLAGSVEALPMFRIFDRLGVGKLARNQIKRNAADSAMFVGSQAMFEAGQEGGQTIIERATVKFLDDHFEIFDEKGKGEILNAMAAGGIIGGGTGGLAEVINAIRSKDSDPYEEMDGESERVAARSRRQFDKLKDMPELQAELQGLSELGLDNPYVAQRLDELGVKNAKSIGGREAVPALLRWSTGVDDLTQKEIDDITGVALGEIEMDATVRKELLTLFITDDNLNKALVDVATTITGKPYPSADRDPEQWHYNPDLLAAQQSSFSRVERKLDAAEENDIGALLDSANRPEEFLRTQNPSEALYVNRDLTPASKGIPNMSAALNKVLNNISDTSFKKRIAELDKEFPDIDHREVTLLESMKGESREAMQARARKEFKRLYDDSEKNKNTIERRAKLTEMFDEEAPEKFLAMFSVIERRKKASIFAGDIQALTEQQQFRGAPAVDGSNKATEAVLREVPFGAMKPRDSQISMQLGKKKYFAYPARIVTRMLTKQGMKVEDATPDELISALNSGVAALLNHGFKMPNAISPKTILKYAKGKDGLVEPVTYGQLTGGDTSLLNKYKNNMADLERVVTESMRVRKTLRDSLHGEEKVDVTEVNNKIAEIDETITHAIARMGRVETELDGLETDVVIEDLISNKNIAAAVRQGIIAKEAMKNDREFASDEGQNMFEVLSAVEDNANYGERAKDEFGLRLFKPKVEPKRRRDSMFSDRASDLITVQTVKEQYIQSLKDAGVEEDKMRIPSDAEFLSKITRKRELAAHRARKKDIASRGRRLTREEFIAWEDTPRRDTAADTKTRKRLDEEYRKVVAEMNDLANNPDLNVQRVAKNKASDRQDIIKDGSVDARSFANATFFGQDLAGSLTDEQVAQAQAFHREEAILVENWSRQFGIDMPRLASAEDILSGKDGLLEMYDNATSRIYGKSIPAKNVMSINPVITMKKMRMTILAHEFGHMLLVKKFGDMLKSGELQAIVDDYAAWLGLQSPLTAVAEMKAQVLPVEFIIQELMIEKEHRAFYELSEQDRQYVIDFQEWFANNVARFLVEKETPISELTTAEKIFKEIADMLQKFYNILVGTKFEPAQNVDSFLRSILDGDRTAKVNTTRRFHVEEIATYIGRMPEVEKAVNELMKGVKTEDAIAAGAYHGLTPFSEMSAEAMSSVLPTHLSPDQKKTLTQAFSGKYIQQQLHKLLEGNPIEQGMVAINPYLAIAYGYQFWLAGNLNIGPSADQGMKLLNDLYESLSGLLQNSTQATAIFEMMTNTMPAQVSSYPVVTRISKTLLQRNFQIIHDALQRIQPFIDALVQSATGRMYETGNPFLIQLAKLFDAPSFDSENLAPAFFEARTHYRGEWGHRWARTWEQFSEEEHKQALELLHNPDKFEAADVGSKPRQLAAATRNLLSNMFDQYLAPVFGKDPAKHKRRDYFPWVFDPKYLQEHTDEFIALLSQPQYKAKLEEIAKAMQIAQFERFMSKQKPGMTETEIAEMLDFFEVSPTQIPGMIVESIANHDGATEGHIKVDDTVGHIPFMAALNERSLSWVEALGTEADKEALAKFFDKNLDHTVVTYIRQAVNRTEFERQFGMSAENTQQMLKMYKGPVDPQKQFENGIQVMLALAAEAGATNEELSMAMSYVDSMMGTNGIRTNARLMNFFGLELKPGQVIHPVLQKVFGAIMVMQNMALLSLATFTSLADPVGIAVRSGSFTPLMTGLRAGMEEIVALSKGDRTTLRQIGEALGTIENELTNEALEWQYGATWLSPKMKWANEKFFKYIGLTGWTRLTRIMALAAGRSFMKMHMGMDTDISDRFMRELGLQKGDIVLGADGQVKILTLVDKDAAPAEEIARDNRVRNALNRFVDQSILRPNAAQRPIWASDPHYALIFHLKSFLWSFHERILKRIASEMDQGNFMPMAMALTFVPAMMAADILRDLLRSILGEEGRWNRTFGDRTWSAVQRSGLTGLGQMGIDAQRDIQYSGFDGGIAGALGPTAENLVGNLDDLMFGNDREQWDAFRTNIPFGNSVVGLPLEALFVDEGLANGTD